MEHADFRIFQYLIDIQNPSYELFDGDFRVELCDPAGTLAENHRLLAMANLTR